MCGIMGAASQAPVPKTDLQLLVMQNRERGKHSFGFSANGDVYKRAIDPMEFMELYFHDPEEFPQEYKTFIGHTRHATFGNPKLSDNAHPFIHGNLIGTHNGTIRNHKELQKIFNTDFDVDSNFLYWLINEFGLEKTLPLLQGQLSLAWYDVNNVDTVYLYRFDKPLSIGFKTIENEDGKKERANYYASLPEYLRVIGCSDVMEIPEHTLCILRPNRKPHFRNIGKRFKPTKQNVDPSNKYNKDAWKVVTYNFLENVDRFAKLGEDVEKRVRELHTKKPSRIAGFLGHRTDEELEHPPQVARFKEEDIPNHSISEFYGEEEIASWWVDDNDIGLVFLYLHDATTLSSYNFTLKEEVQRFLKSHPSIGEPVISWYKQITESVELRGLRGK